MKRNFSDETHQRARRLRREMTDAERTLWRLLSSKQLEGFKFRRQVPIGRFIVDFACHSATLIIEVDGGQHDSANCHEAERTAFLEAAGYRVLRFWNNDILGNSEGVFATIAGALWKDHPHPTLPPQGGGLIDSSEL